MNLIAAVIAVLLAAGAATAVHPSTAGDPVAGGDLPAAGTASACDATLTRAEAVRTGRGQSRQPRYSAVQRFVNGLAPGETGCLRRGTYAGDVAIARSRVTLQSRPGERARIVGRLWIKRAAHGVELRSLALDGRNAARLPSPTVNGDEARFVDVDVTNHNSGICFILGSSRYGRAQGTVIERSRIHHCGRLPADNTEHGIYVSTADDTRIAGNLIYANAARGIQLYPDAQRTLIERNVIDGNGEGIIFSGADGVTSNGNVVQRNVISNSTIRADVESWYPEGTPPGVGNVVRGNCVFGGRSGTIDTSAGGFDVAANVVADPQFADPEAGDFSVSGTSPCAAILDGP